MAVWQTGLSTFWTLKLHSGLFAWTVTLRKKTVMQTDPLELPNIPQLLAELLKGWKAAWVGLWRSFL